MAARSGLVLAVALMLAVATVVEGQGCSIVTMLPCLQAAQGKAPPTQACCDAVVKLGTQPNGPQCLCSLVTNEQAVARGVNPDMAMAIPSKCHARVPPGFVCNGKRVPGS